MTVPPPEGGVMVIPLVLPKSKLLVADGDPVNEIALIPTYVALNVVTEIFA